MHALRMIPVAFVCALQSAPLSAQRPIYGDRIRAKPLGSAMTTEWTDASVIRLAGDTLWYESAAGLPAPLFLSENDILVGRSYSRGGKILGGLVGAAVGAAVAYSAFEPRYESELGDVLSCFFLGCVPTQTQANSRSEETLAGASIGAGAGVLLGWLIGRSFWSWTAVDLTHLNASAGGFAIGLTWSGSGL